MHGKWSFGIALAVCIVLGTTNKCKGDDNDSKPICRIAVVSNVYMTSQTAKELGVKRSFLARTAPDGLRRAVTAVNAIKPDAFIVLGSLTWTGSDADYQLVRKHLDKVKAPLYTTPGPNDLKEDGIARYKKYFAKENVAGRGLTINGVHLEFALPSHKRGAAADQALIAQMKTNFAKANKAKAVLLIGGPEVTEPRPAGASALQKAYWQLIHKHNVAARLTVGHAHTVRYQDSLPIWSIPSSGWSYTPKFLCALITVYPKRIELALKREPYQPMQTLDIPNPVAAKRMATREADPYKTPTFSEDLAKKPDLTFVQLSDSQFDNSTIPRYKARYRYDEQMNKLAVRQVNRLKPPMVFMTGDLTNNNSPSEWQTFGKIYGKLQPTLYSMPGNHDTLFDRAKVNRKTLKDLYDVQSNNWKFVDKLTGKKTVDQTTMYQHFMKRKPYYTVEKAGCVFLCLNTGFASVDGKQMEWLRGELERTKNAKHVFVLGHYPVLKVFGGNVQGPEAVEILHLLRKYKVAAYLSGHRHRYDYRVKDYTAHVLCDCLCWGEYRSFQIYHVFPDRIVACWKPLFRADGNRPLYERVVFPEPRGRSD